MQNQVIDLLKNFISDRIRQRKEEVVAIYGAAEEQQAQLDELRRLEVEARLQNAVFNYAKWFSGRNEIVVLESIIVKIKEFEQKIGEQAKSNYETDGRKK